MSSPRTIIISRNPDTDYKLKRYLRWIRHRQLDVLTYTPDACPAHAGLPLLLRLAIIFDLKPLLTATSQL